MDKKLKIMANFSCVGATCNALNSFDCAGDLYAFEFRCVNGKKLVTIMLDHFKNVI